jgi:hypothetical protein
MKYIAIICLIILTACNNHKPKKEFDLPKSYYYKTDKNLQRHAIINYNAKRDSSILGINAKSATLSNEDVVKIESLIKEKALIYNKMHTYKPITEPEKYYKQFIAVIDSKGDKIVWVECFCEAFGNDWKKELQDVDDGGSCFFRLKINLTTNKVIAFSTNGIA